VGALPDGPCLGHRRLTRGPDHEPLWVKLAVSPVGDQGRAGILVDGRGRGTPR